MIRIVIGTEDSQLIPQKVLEYSIRAHTKQPVEFHVLKQDISRIGGTNFGFVRFMIPSHFNFQGRAIYMDADQLVLGDVAELWESLNQAHDIALVQNAEGSFNNQPVSKGNQTSVMVMNCERLQEWALEKLFTNIIPNRQTPQPGQILYRDFMMLKWFEPGRLQALDPRWNHFNIVKTDTRLVHFSHVRSQPWKQPHHPLTPLWRSWLRQAVKDGAVKRSELAAEIFKGHLLLNFLKDLL